MKKKFQFLLKFLVITASLLYLFLKLKEVDFQSFLKEINKDNFFFLILAVFFMPLNWFLEAIKWKNLISVKEKITIITALKGILIGLATGVITPNRIGEIAGRPLVLKNTKKKDAYTLTMLASLTQFSITLIAGLCGTTYLYFIFFRFKKIIFLSFLILILLIGMIFLYKKIIPADWQEKIKVLQEVKFSLFSSALLLSFLRYLIFIFQFFLLLKFFNAQISLAEAVAGISTIYLIINLLPHFLIADFGIRGSASVLILGIFEKNLAAIAFAPIALWMINIAVPLVAGIFLFASIRRF